MSATMFDQAIAPSRPRPQAAAWRLASAEFLKVRRRRGLLALAATLTVIAIVGAGIVLAILHAENPAQYGPVGGIAHLSDAGYLLSSLGVVAAILVGATMGAADVQAGVFRDLVATGRSRLALFAAKIPGGLGLLWPLVIGAWAVASAGCVLLAGSQPRPGFGLIMQGGAWVLLAVTVSYLIALGLASLSGSRSAPVGILLAWEFIVTPLALHTSTLGVLREGLLGAGLDRLIPSALMSGRPDPVSSSMSILVAVIVITAWAVIPVAAGAWRTLTRDA